MILLWNVGIWRKGNGLETGRELSSPSVSVKDRSLSGPVIEFELY